MQEQADVMEGFHGRSSCSLLSCAAFLPFDQIQHRYPLACWGPLVFFVKKVLKFSHNSVNMLLLDVLMLHVGTIHRVPPMKPMAADAPGVPAAMHLVLAFGILLLVAAFPTRFRIVILERKHSQPQSNKQSNHPKNWGNGTPILVPHVSDNGE